MITSWEGRPALAVPTTDKDGTKGSRWRPARRLKDRLTLGRCELYSEGLSIDVLYQVDDTQEVEELKDVVMS
jgi:hypothetical protein